ncbi:MAG: CBS domain-containing protein [Candidatus Anammoxibacter sp.]
MKVGDVMKKDIHSVKRDTTIMEIVKILCINRISGIPIVDDENHIIGIISEKDVLRAMYPSQAEYYEDPSCRNFDEIEQRYANIISMNVEQIMNRNTITTSPDEPLLKASSTMLVRKIRRLPVLDNGKLVGIITQSDIHQAIFQKHFLDKK